MLERERKGVNPVGNPRIRPIAPKPEAPQGTPTREGFFRDLKKASRRRPK